MSEIIISTTNLTKQYGKKKAVDSVSVHIRQGEIYGFIGRNGAGKTTFMKMISGLSGQTSGEISLFGAKGAESDRMRSRIGTLIEAPGLYPNMTAHQNLRLKTVSVGINRPGYIEELIELVGLSNVKNTPTKKFSLGMKQRLGIAMALVGDPDILVLDEPINGLDPQGIVEVRDILLKLNKERRITILISSHILEELSKVATSYGIINNGRLIAEMSSEELFAQCEEKIEIKVDEPSAVSPILDSLGIQKYKTVDSGTIEVYDDLDRVPDIAEAIVMKGIRLNGITKKNENLEDFYLGITR